MTMNAAIYTLSATMSELWYDKNGQRKTELSESERVYHDSLDAAKKNLMNAGSTELLPSKSNPGSQINVSAMDIAPQERNRPRSRLCADIFQQRPETHGFKSLEEFTAAMTHGDPRVMALAGQGIGNPADGGFAVPPAFAFETLDKSLESEVVRPRCRIEPMESPQKSISTYDDSDHSSGQLYGGFQGQWIEEGGTISYQVAKLRRLQLNAHKLAFLTAASNELLNDAPGFEGGFTSRITKTIGWNIDRTLLITGTGAGQPKSVLNDPATITVDKDSGQVAATITYSNLCNMFARLSPSCLNNAIWVANPTAIPQLLQLFQIIGVAGSAVPVMSKNAAGQFEILTRPVVFSEKMNSLGTLGDIMLVDLSQYVFGMMKNGMRLDRSDHVRFTTDEAAWRVVLRADGQGTWKQAFVPVNGSSLSWAVTLQAR